MEMLKHSFCSFICHIIGAAILVVTTANCYATSASAVTVTGTSNHLKWVDINRGDVNISDEVMPFFPHRANTSSGAPLEFHAFEGSQICSACHTDIYNQWRSSMMAYSWDDPIYRGMLKMASEASEGQLNNFCTGCHSPIGLTSGKINDHAVRSTEKESSPLPGVDCESCHTLNAKTGLDNGAFVLAPDSENPIKYGPRSDAVSPYHATQQSTLHTESAICGTCHNVTHPFNNVPIERTYDEWLESPYAKENVQCQDCHMKAYKGKAALMGPERDQVAGHDFSGANTTVLNYFGEQQQAEKGRAMLRSAAELEITHLTSMALPGDTLELSVKVSNTGAGHKLPTGFPEGREVWLEIIVRDADGTPIYHSGNIEKGQTAPGTRNFKVHLGDKDGNEVDLEVWNVTHVISDNRILPKGFAKEHYTIPVPNDAAFPLSLDIKLNYWPFSQALVDRILGDKSIPVEVVEMDQIQAEIENRLANAQAKRP